MQTKQQLIDQAVKDVDAISDGGLIPSQVKALIILHVASAYDKGREDAQEKTEPKEDLREWDENANQW